MVNQSANEGKVTTQAFIKLWCILQGSWIQDTLLPLCRTKDFDDIYHDAQRYSTIPYLWQWSCWLDHWIVSLLVWLWTQETRHYPRVWNTEVANSLCAHLFSKIKPRLNLNLIIEEAMTVCWKGYDNRAIGSKIGIFHFNAHLMWVQFSGF